MTNRAQPAADKAPSDHVAWLRYVCHGQHEDSGADILTIEVCDSDAEGAFKVYTRAQSAAVDAAVEALKAAERDGEPHKEGFCENGCNNWQQMILDKETVTYPNGVTGDRYRWRHDHPECWYGRVRAALAQLEAARKGEA